jgi:hypothetical protein
MIAEGNAGNRSSAEVLVLFPDFGPGFAGRAADEDVGVVVELFVMDAL